jgi:hypothetical protein
MARRAAGPDDIASIKYCGQGLLGSRSQTLNGTFSVSTAVIGASTL